MENFVLVFMAGCNIYICAIISKPRECTEDFMDSTLKKGGNGRHGN